MVPANLLLGRKTFDIFAHYWPEHEKECLGINDVTKFVMSKTMKKSDWKKLFENGTIPAAFILIENIVTSTRVIIANYRRAGKVEACIIGA